MTVFRMFIVLWQRMLCIRLQYFWNVIIINVYAGVIYNYRRGNGISTRVITKETFKNIYINELNVVSYLKKYLVKYYECRDDLWPVVQNLQELLQKTAVMRFNSLSSYDRNDIINRHLFSDKFLLDFFWIKELPSLKILLAYHKLAELLRTCVYQPILAGSAISHAESKDGVVNPLTMDLFARKIQRDDVGDNISEKNRTLNELTCIYWAWKNYDKIGNPAFFGFGHYRRFFIFDDSLPLPNKTWLPNGSTYCFSNMQEALPYINEEYCFKLLKDYDCLVTKMYDDIYTSKKKTTMKLSYVLHGQGELDPELYDLMEKLVLSKYPDYREEVDFFKTSSRHYFCNMFVFPKILFFKYCEFLFSIIFDINNKCSSNLVEGARAPGYIAEYLTSMFISHNRKLGLYRFKELNTAFLEDTEI